MPRWFNDVMMRTGAEPKKLAVAGLLLAVGLLMWGRLLLKEPPRVATAVPAALAAAGTASTPAQPSDVLRTVAVDLPTDVPRDLFEFDRRRYKRTVTAPELPVSTKLPDQPSDDAIKARAVSEAARSLELQSVLTGATEPHAMINGQLVKAGQTIEGFKIIRVNQRSVELEQNGITIRIGM